MADTNASSSTEKQPASGKPRTGKPGTGKPSSGKPSSGKPSSGKPETSKPEAAAGQSAELSPHQIILRPLVTEKGVHRSTRNNQYAFEVSKRSDKESIKKAVEELFDVKVVRVRTQNRRGKPRRHRYKQGYTSDWKKALVTLDAEDRIDFF